MPGPWVQRLDEPGPPLELQPDESGEAALHFSNRRVTFLRQGAQWRLLYVQQHQGAYLNGDYAFAPDLTLRHGDVVELGAAQVVLRFLEQPEPTARNEALEHALMESPADEQRWQVYGDWLIEQGDPLGARVTAQGPHAERAPDDARVLGPLARAFRAARLEARWRHGFLVEATWRDEVWSVGGRSWGEGFRAGDAGRAVRHLLQQPVARFLEALTVDFDFAARAEGDAVVDPRRPALVARDVLLAVAGAAPPTLASLRFGPVRELEPDSALEEAWRAACARCPRLPTDLLKAFPMPRPSFLVLEQMPDELRVAGWGAGEAKNLDARAAWHFGAAGTRVSGPGAEQVDFSLLAEGGRFRLVASEDVAVNGVGTRRWLLRSGDRLSPLPGLVFRFDA